MKHLFYAGCLLVSMIGFSACNKNNDPAPTPVVVGTWELNQGRLSGFVAPYQQLNSYGLDLYNYDFGSTASRINIRADKSFTNNIRQDGLVTDVNGTWDYTDPTLTLKSNDGTTSTYSYSLTTAIEELVGPTQNINFPVSSTATAPGQLRLVYRKL